MRRILPFLPIIIFLLTGCSARDVGTLLPVQLLALDGATEVTVAAEGELSPMTETGDTLADAMETLRTRGAPEELSFAHIRCLLLGEAGVREALPSLTEQMARSTQTRLTLPLFIVKGEAKALTEDDELLAKLMHAAAEHPHAYTLLDTAIALSHGEAALCCALDADASPIGYAVVDERGVRGYLDADAALGAELLSGTARGAMLTTPSGASVILRRVKASPTLRWEGDEPTLEVEMRVSVAIQSAEGIELGDASARAKLADEVSSTVSAEVSAALGASQTLGADLFSLYRLAERQTPGGVPKLTRGELLSALRCRIFVETVPERTFDMQ